MKKDNKTTITLVEQQKVKAFLKILNAHRITNPEKNLFSVLENSINVDSFLSICSYCYESDNTDLYESVLSFIDSYVELLNNFEKHLGGDTNE